MSRYFVGTMSRWSSGISCRELTPLHPSDKRVAACLLCIPRTGFMYIKKKKKSQPEITLSFGSFLHRYQSAPPAPLRPQHLSSELRPQKNCSISASFISPQPGGARGRSACRGRQRAIKSRRSGKPRANRFTLMSCVARKFDCREKKRKPKKKKNNTHPTPTTVVFSKCSSPL